ncbi:hypothetical protein Lal_00011983 [Lupinus albus]|nr:hypothetical protein Lal_00011983 [Lupinus albus]
MFSCQLRAWAWPGFLMVPKSDDMGRPMTLWAHDLVSTSEDELIFDDFVSRLYRRSRPGEPRSSASLNSPRCQRRDAMLICHRRSTTTGAIRCASFTQRLPQSSLPGFISFLDLTMGKRSCRKRLADHNRRRRKTQHPTQEIPKSQFTLDNVAISPSDSGAQSSSLVTVAVSPPDYFRQRPYQSTSPSTTSSSLFFSSG